MSKVKKKCPHCGAGMMVNKFPLNKPIVKGLAAFYDSGGGPTEVKTMGLTNTQYTNFQKLRYWQLIERPEGDKSRWQITALGIAFLGGSQPLYKNVYVYRGRIQRFDGPGVTLDELEDGWKKKADYVADAEPYKP